MKRRIYDFSEKWKVNVREISEVCSIFNIIYKQKYLKLY